MDRLNNFAPHRIDGGLVAHNSSSTKKVPISKIDAQPLSGAETIDRIHEGRNNFFTGILIVLPASALLWGFLIWIGKRLLF